MIGCDMNACDRNILLYDMNDHDMSACDRNILLYDMNDRDMSAHDECT